MQAVQEQLGELLTTEQIDALLMGAALTVRPAQSGDATWVSNSEGTTKYDKTAGGQYAEYDGPNIWVNQPIHERVFILGATTVDTTHNVSTAVKHAAKLYGLNFDITLTLSSAYTLILGQDTLELVMNNNAGEAGSSGSITSIEYLP